MNDFEPIIVSKAKILSQELIKQRGAKPPFTARDYATLLGIGNIVVEDIGEVSGILIKGNLGPIIKLNSKHNYRRQNFSLAHELAHLIVDRVIVNKTNDNIAFRSVNSSNTIERLCNVAATEMLMPEAVFSKYLETLGTSIVSVAKLSEMFAVSLQAALIRVSELSRTTTIALCWRLREGKRSNHLALEWSTTPKIADKKLICKPVKPTIGANETTIQAFMNDDVIKTYKEFYINGCLKKRCLLESKGFGLKNNRRVLSLAFVET
jgi:Zn-dependent peptidase ImmA (M78 family)